MLETLDSMGVQHYDVMDNFFFIRACSSNSPPVFCELQEKVQAAPKLTREEALRTDSLELKGLCGKPISFTRWRKLDMVPRQRGTRPLFSAAQLVPFFEDRTLGVEKSPQASL